MDLEEYEQGLRKLKNKEQHFREINFTSTADAFKLAIEMIEKLWNEKEIKSDEKIQAQ